MKKGISVMTPLATRPPTEGVSRLRDTLRSAGRVPAQLTRQYRCTSIQSDASFALTRKFFVLARQFYIRYYCLDLKCLALA
eukprot:2651995-Pleurochrysis_carterae.AAC.2